MSRYTQLVSAPAGERRMRVAVVGAGLAGLTTARVLQDQGHDVVVVEKARGPGGRMATRRHEPWCFDHGAQYFTARDPRFLRHVEAWRERGLVEAWEGRIGVLEGGRILAAGSGTERFVAVPGMSAICRAMAAELADCRFDWQVQSAIFEADAWRLQAGDNSHLEADALVISTPPDQVGPLLPQMFLSESVDQSLQGLDMEPCWALMAVFDRPLLADWDAAFVNAMVTREPRGGRGRGGGRTAGRRAPAARCRLRADPVRNGPPLALRTGPRTPGLRSPVVR
jgi:predicted NAD/FAD-dependent oxidoreductase